MPLLAKELSTLPVQEQAKIIDHQEVTAGFYRMVLECPTIAKEAKPGQFVHVLVGAKNSRDPLLRRPISLHGIDRHKGTITLLYQVVGRGTQALAIKLPREELDVMGPLGNGFKLTAKQTPCLVIAGGIGVAPLLPLLKELMEQGRETAMLLGAKTKEWVLAQGEIEAMGIPVRIATDDGSLGHHGLVTELLEQSFTAGTPWEYYACGPEPMLKAVVARMEKAGVPGQVSLEERMGCGVGACLACVCRVKVKTDAQAFSGAEPGPESEPQWTYKKVCLDGPVFNAGEVVW